MVWFFTLSIFTSLVLFFKEEKSLEEQVLKLHSEPNPSPLTQTAKLLSLAVPSSFDGRYWEKGGMCFCTF